MRTKLKVSLKALVSMCGVLRDLASIVSFGAEGCGADGKLSPALLLEPLELLTTSEARSGGRGGMGVDVVGAGGASGRRGNCRGGVGAEAVVVGTGAAVRVHNGVSVGLALVVAGVEAADRASGCTSVRLLKGDVAHATLESKGGSEF